MIKNSSSSAFFSSSEILAKNHGSNFFHEQKLMRKQVRIIGRHARIISRTKSIKELNNRQFH